MVRNAKLKLFLVALLLIAVIVYFSWAIVATYVLMDIHNDPNMDIRATDVTHIVGGDLYNDGLTDYEFGLISARLDNTKIISDTMKPDLTLTTV